MTQLYEYNHEENDCAYTKPCLDLHTAQKNWASLTAGLSEEEIADLSESRATLENYEKIYSIVEYCSQMHENITCLQRKMMSNNVTIPQNMYRKCGANSPEALFPEMDAYLQAYFDLLDDCKDHPVWKRKLEEDLGSSVSFLGIQMEEAIRDSMVEASPAYARFDSEKQIYFK